MRYSDFKDAIGNEYVREAYNIFKKKEKDFHLLNMYAIGGFSDMFCPHLVVIEYMDKFLQEKYKYNFYLDKWSGEIEGFEKEEMA